MIDDERFTGAGERIATARRRAGMTQGDLARAVGVSRSAIAQWETDRAGQLRLHLARLAATLKVSVGYLMAGEEAPTPTPETSQELALLRVFRALDEMDRQRLLRYAVRMERGTHRGHTPLPR